MPCYVYRRWRTWHVHHEGQDSGYGLQQQGRGSEAKVRTAPQNRLTSGSNPYFGWHLFGILAILFSHCLYDWLLKKTKKNNNKKQLTHVIQSNDELDCWLGGKPKNELKNHFLTNDFLKINEHVQQTTILIANKTAYVENWITSDTVIFSLQMDIASFEIFVFIALRRRFCTKLDTDLVALFKTGQ